jgi:hypothetical protein
LKGKQGVILGNSTGIFYKCMLYDKFRAPVRWGNIKREKYDRRKKGKMKAIKGTGVKYTFAKGAKIKNKGCARNIFCCVAGKTKNFIFEERGKKIDFTDP